MFALYFNIVSPLCNFTVAVSVCPVYCTKKQLLNGFLWVFSFTGVVLRIEVNGGEYTNASEHKKKEKKAVTGRPYNHTEPYILLIQSNRTVSDFNDLVSHRRSSFGSCNKPIFRGDFFLEDLYVRKVDT